MTRDQIKSNVAFGGKPLSGFKQCPFCGDKTTIAYYCVNSNQTDRNKDGSIILLGIIECTHCGIRKVQKDKIFKCDTHEDSYKFSILQARKEWNVRL